MSASANDLFSWTQWLAFSGLSVLAVGSALVWADRPGGRKPANEWDSGLIGAQACRVCHEKEYQDWLSTPHARAYDVLTAEQAEDDKCVDCHSTGRQPNLTGVQCESCHGPGLHYWPDFVMRDLPLARMLGLRKAADASLCGRCHTKETPSIRGFDYNRDIHRVNHSLGPRRIQ